MGKIINFNDYKKVIGEEIGSVCVSIYKDKITGCIFFRINSDSKEVLPVSSIIENALCDF